VDTNTRFEPLPADRARQLFDLMAEVRDDPDTALALDDAGRVTGVVPADAPRQRHLLGDLDVHA
jgi:hypothetical protein